MHAVVPARLATSENDQTIYVAGLVALRDGDCATAIPLLEHAVRSMPFHTGRLCNLARALLAAERYEAAAQAATAARDLHPGDPDVLSVLGSALSSLGDFARAVTIFQESLTVRPDHAPSWLSLANLFTDLDDLASAESHCRRALELEPALAEAHTSLGYVLTRTGRLQDAIAACNAALLCRPDLPHAHWNRAIALLLSGDLASGF